MAIRRSSQSANNAQANIAKADEARERVQVKLSNRRTMKMRTREQSLKERMRKARTCLKETLCGKSLTNRAQKVTSKGMLETRLRSLMSF